MTHNKIIAKIETMSKHDKHLTKVMNTTKHPVLSQPTKQWDTTWWKTGYSFVSPVKLT